MTKILDKDKIKRLLIPLAILAIITLGLAFCQTDTKWESFLIGLSANAISIIITVLYIDWVLKQQESKYRQVAQDRVNWRVFRYFNSCIACCRISLGIGIEVLNMEAVASRDVNVHNTELLRVIQEHIKPEARRLIEGLDSRQWTNLYNEMLTIQDLSDRLLITFGQQIEPKIFAAVLDIEEQANGAWHIYADFSDVLGVHDHPQAHMLVHSKDIVGGHIFKICDLVVDIYKVPSMLSDSVQRYWKDSL